MSSPTSPRLNETRALGGWGHTSLSLRPETVPGAGQGSTAQTHQEGLTEAATFHKGLEGQVRGDDCWVRRVRKAAARESLSSRSVLLPERHRRQEGRTSGRSMGRRQRAVRADPGTRGPGRSPLCPAGPARALLQTGRLSRAPGVLGLGEGAGRHNGVFSQLGAATQNTEHTCSVLL